MNKLISKLLCLTIEKTDALFPETKLIPVIKKAIFYVEDLKQKDAKTYSSSHSRKTWLAVDEALRLNGTRSVIEDIIGTDNEDIIKGFLFAKTKYYYDNKIK